MEWLAFKVSLKNTKIAFFKDVLVNILRGGFALNKEHNKSTISMLLQSVFLIVICCACLIGSTFAWFTSASMTNVESVNSSELMFDVSVTEKVSGTQVNIDNDTLQSGNSYIINLSISDNSTAKKGYCAIRIQDVDGITIYFTPIFEKGVLESKAIEFVVGKECKIDVVSSWGEHNKDICCDKINYFAYNIVYNLDDGVLSTPNPNVYSTISSTTLNNPTKEGYEFVGWIGSNGDEPQTTVIIDQNSTGDKEYTAIWKIIETYNITYDLNEGSFLGVAPSSYSSNSEEFCLHTPVKEGFEFVGWTGSNGDAPEKVVTLPDGVFENKHYVANWIEAVEPSNEDQDEADNEEDEEAPDEENNNGDESDESGNDENVPPSDDDKDDGQDDNQNNESDNPQNDDKKDDTSDEPNGDESNENPDDTANGVDNGEDDDKGDDSSKNSDTHEDSPEPASQDNGNSDGDDAPNGDISIPESDQTDDGSDVGDVGSEPGDE